MGEMPLMTDYGSFIINGTERVIVSQLHRSPGVFFEHDKGKTHCSGKLLFSARIIPYRGSWLDFEFDPKDVLYFRVDRRRKMPVTILLKAIGLNPEAILANFFVFDNFRLMDSGAQMEFVAERLRGEVARFDITDKEGNVIVAEGQAHQRASTFATSSSAKTQVHLGAGRLSARPRAGEATSSTPTRASHRQGQRRDDRSAARRSCATPASRTSRRSTRTISTRAPYISPDAAHRRNGRPAGRARRDLPHDAPRRAADRRRRRGAVQPPVLQRRHVRPVARGPHEVQRRSAATRSIGPMTLPDDDILAVVKILVDLRNGRGEVDDIDHLGNRRVRCVGELAENQYRTRPGARREGRQGTSRPGRERKP